MDGFLSREEQGPKLLSVPRSAAWTAVCWESGGTKAQCEHVARVGREGERELSRGQDSMEKRRGGKILHTFRCDGARWRVEEVQRASRGQGPWALGGTLTTCGWPS